MVVVVVVLLLLLVVVVVLVVVLVLVVVWSAALRSRLTPRRVSGSRQTYHSNYGYHLAWA